MSLSLHAKDRLNHALEHSGQRPTKQREHVFDVLLTWRDHPTADEVYARAKEGMPSISLATVYNCLETLTECGLIKAVNYKRESTRYCPNLTFHAHFRDRSSGHIYDVELTEEISNQLEGLLPEGFSIDMIELNFYGKAGEGSTARPHSH